jgi:ArsR family transcriptional regulator
MSVLNLVPDEKELEFKSRIFKVIGDSNRLKILEILRSGENCQCDIIPLIAQSQPTVSRHLRLLEEAGLISSRKVGTKMFYKVVDTQVYNIIDALNNDLMKAVSNEIVKKFGL